jgi:molybdate-binding protein
MLARGEVHAAGVHFHNDNLPHAQAALRGEATLVELGVWQEGLALAPGNPKQIHAISDLARADIRLVNRELGAGCRSLLDAMLSEASIPTSAVLGYENEVKGHVEVAQVIVSNHADAGITVSAVAHAHGLEFLPLRSVRYELAMLPETFALPAMLQLLETLQHRWIRTQLKEVGDYDIAATGVARS